MRTRIILTVLALGMLAGCVSGKPQTDTYTDRSGKVTTIENDREQCSHACDVDYSRCMDTTAARDNPIAGAPAGMFGASSDCRASLKQCSSGCKTR